MVVEEGVEAHFLLGVPAHKVTGLPDKAVSITVKDASFERPVCDEFSPLRDSGPHIPDNFDVSPLSLFEIYFDDEAPDEEKNMADHKLRKILAYHNHIKSKCSDLYQPLGELSIDERMVKTKVRTLFRQYIRNKPTKWGMKYWVLVDRSGYTVDFNIYAGRSTTYSGNGLSFDVVMELIEPYVFQCYELFIDNFYTSPVLLEKLLEYGIVGTGTLNVTRRNVPREVVAMQKAVEKHSVLHGTGYFFRSHDSKITFCVWHDTKTLAMASNAFSGHSENTVVRRVKDSTSGSSISKEVPCPIMLTKCNKSMGGVDKSDQYMSYHKILRPTVKYWKTMFFFTQWTLLQ